MISFAGWVTVCAVLDIGILIVSQPRRAITIASVSSRGRKWLVVVAVLAVAGVLLAPVVRDHLRALYVLQRLQDGNSRPAVAPLVERGYAESELTLQTPEGPTRARLYLPAKPSGAPGMVVVHGVHFDGIDDPRMRAFAAALAGVGIPVLTPHITALTQLRVEPGEIAVIGASAEELARRTGGKVGVMALSFAGGLALMAAADPRYAPSIAYVFAVGPHASMARVAHFYATDEEPRPDGTVEHERAHPYGAMIFIYTYPEDFFSPEEVPVARQALWLALNEKEDAARAEAQKLSPATRGRLESLAVQWNATPELRQELLRSIALHAAEMDAVSPEGKLAGLRVPVFLLHGTADDVIPAAESQWLARDLPPGTLRALLLSKVISHVETGGKPTLSDQWELVHLLATIFGAH
jgi:pimeloyl-ACP methyl ester carboxylesterase